MANLTISLSDAIPAGDAPPNFAERLANAATALDPEAFDAWAATELAAAPEDVAMRKALVAHCINAKRYDRAVALCREVLRIAPSVDANYKLVNTLLLRGDLDAAEKRARKALRKYPSATPFNLSLGEIARMRGRHEEAIAQFDQATADERTRIPGLLGKARGHAARGRPELAMEQLETALQIDPFAVRSLTLFAQMAVALGRVDEAKHAFRTAYETAPKDINLAREYALFLLDKHLDSEAIQVLKALVREVPDDVRTYVNLADALQRTGDLDNAISCLQIALQLGRETEMVYTQLGMLLNDHAMHELALAQFDKALDADPAFPAALSMRARALSALKRHAEAVEAFRHALEVNPGLAPDRHNFGNLLRETGREAEAIEHYEAAFALDPSIETAKLTAIILRRYACDWSRFDEDVAMAGRLGLGASGVVPFEALTLEDAPERHRVRSERFALAQYGNGIQKVFSPPKIPKDKIVLGYFSADFHTFPGMFLMAGLLEQHDRDRFEVLALSYGPDREDAMRKRIRAGVDRFIDIRELSTHDAVKLSREIGIDIAFHRNGYTRNARTDVFANRVAPIQINYLGYPGTLGARFIDYIVGDPWTIPDETRDAYCESVIYMPSTYQPNDNTRPVPMPMTTRAQNGLPEDAVVLCCFNNTYKISPLEFDIWMEVLNSVPGTVLWLLKPNDGVQENLRREAGARGVDPGRIVFAPTIEHADHMERQRHADLFLDCFNYNAHTTASDALWSGVPIVTKAGAQFAARVAASLLNAAGMAELITHTPEDYKARIIALAQSPHEIARLKAYLTGNRESLPLFDTAYYARSLEAGLEIAYDRFRQGLPPSDIRPGAALNGAGAAFSAAGSSA